MEGIQPSFEPTVLWYPAVKPPVKAPWKRFRPNSSRASCFQTGTNLSASAEDEGSVVPRILTIHTQLVSYDWSNIFLSLFM